VRRPVIKKYQGQIKSVRRLSTSTSDKAPYSCRIKAAMAKRSVEAFPQFYARTGGLLYLIIIALGVFAEAFARGRIIVFGDAAATATRLTSMETLWRYGIAAEYLAITCAIGLAMIYFVLLMPVSRELTLLATFLRLGSLIVQAVAVMDLTAALFPVSNAVYLNAFTSEQRAALASFAIRAHSQNYGVALLILGFCFLVHGYLIFRSGFLPKLLGILIQLAGMSYLINSAALLVAPAWSAMLFPLILLPAFIGEASLCLWLLIKGVDVLKWRERAAEGRSTAALRPLS
jgi:hypothetical protein